MCGLDNHPDIKDHDPIVFDNKVDYHCDCKGHQHQGNNELPLFVDAYHSARSDEKAKN